MREKTVKIYYSDVGFWFLADSNFTLFLSVSMFKIHFVTPLQFTLKYVHVNSSFFKRTMFF